MKAIYLSKLYDRDVIRAFEKVLSKLPGDGGVVSFSDVLGSVDGDLLDKYRKASSHLLDSATLRYGRNLAWEWRRLGPGSGDSLEASFDKLTFRYPQNAQPSIDRDFVFEVQAALEKQLERSLVDRHASDGSDFGHGEVLKALESATAQVLVEAAAHRQSVEESYVSRETALTERFEADRQRDIERIEKERVRVEAVLGDREKAIDERASQLDDLQRRLDDRNNTHVRRQIRESLLDLAKERLANFSVSKETRFQYYAVHAVSIMGIVSLAFAALQYGASAVGLEVGSTAFVISSVKSSLLFAAAVTLGSWYLGWLNKWLQRIADAEFRLQQFRLDIERASWLAETVLEWKSTSEEPFPESLASRLSAGLFQDGASNSEGPKTPSTYIADALFGAASSAKLRVGDQELNLDRRAIKELGKGD